MMFGPYGSISFQAIILYGHAKWVKTRTFRFFIHAFKLKIHPLECFPICLYREAIHLQCFPPTCYVIGVTHTYMNVTTFTQFPRNSHIYFGACFHCMVYIVHVTTL